MANLSSGLNGEVRIQRIKCPGGGINRDFHFTELIEEAIFFMASQHSRDGKVFE
jgi:hypothetical protein